MANSIYRTITDRATPEAVMLVGMLVVSSYMLVESFAFSYQVALFPRFTAIMTICGVLLLLVRGYLPESVRNAVDDSGSMFDYEEDELVESEEAVTSQAERDGEHGDASPHAERQQAILVGLLAGYGVVGYAIGLVLATPLFVIAYSALFGIRKRIAAVLLGVAIAIALSFDYILPVDLMQGGL